MKGVFARVINGSVRLKVTGLNKNTFLRKMQMKGVIFSGLMFNEDGFTFSVSYYDYRKIKSYCKKANLKVEVVKEYNIKTFFTFLLKKSGIFLGLLFWVCFGLGFYNNYFDVCVSLSGKEFESESIKSEIDGFLTNEINSGTTNLRQLERNVINKFSQVSTCSVTKKGIYYMVTVTPVITQKVVNEIVSPYNCKIKEITVGSGQALVKSGDVVAKGQVLVQSRTLANGIVEPAKATIVVDAFVIGSVYFDGTANEVRRTGRTQTSRMIDVLGLKIDGNKGCDFAYFEEERVSKLISKNNILPVKIEEITYYELEIVETNVEFSQVQQDLYDKAKENAVALLPDEVSEFDCTYAVTNEGSKYKIDCYLKFVYSFC